MPSPRLAAVLVGALACTGLATTTGPAAAAHSTGCEGGAFARCRPAAPSRATRSCAWTAAV